MHVICPTCQFFFPNNRNRTASGRRVRRLRGFWPWGDRLERWLRLCRSYGGAHSVGRRRGRRVDGFRTQRMRPVPGAVINQQQRNQPDGRNNHRTRDRSEFSLRVIPVHGDWRYLSSALPNKTHRTARSSRKLARCPQTAACLVTRNTVDRKNRPISRRCRHFCNCAAATPSILRNSLRSRRISRGQSLPRRYARQSAARLRRRWHIAAGTP
jgi:hypothetical protein